MGTTTTTIVNIKTDPQVKKKAQKIASELGLSLSGVINGFLRQFIRTKRVDFSLKEENPSPQLLADLKAAEEERKKGDYYSFDDPQKAIEFIRKI